MRRLALLVGGTAILGSLGVAPALAHPLGNYAVGHHLGLVISGNGANVTYIVDMAEIPTFQALRDVDTNDDGVTDPTERTGWAVAECAGRGGRLDLGVDGDPQTLTPTGSEMSTAPGQAGLETLRLICGYTASFVPVAGTSIEVGNRNDPSRLGWREVVIAGSGVTVRSDLPATSPSAELTRYPSGGTLLDVREGLGTVTAVSAETVLVAAAEAGAAPALVGGGGLLATLGGLVGAPGLGPGALLVGLGAAFALGVGHALAPGHGKTIMAAYLVGRHGTARHAVGLGLSVAVSHTIGVVVLGLVTLAASSAFTPERIYPVVSVLSGLIILSLGVSLLVRSVRRLRRGRRIDHHGHDHGHEPGHDHGDGQRHDHAHDHDPAVDHRPGWLGLAALGLSGGLVPSASAVVLLLGALQLGRTELGLVLVLCFGLGMAATLVGVGLLVVTARTHTLGRLERRPIPLRLAVAAPVVAGAIVMLLGAVMTASALRSLGT